MFPWESNTKGMAEGVQVVKLFLHEGVAQI
jgi:hypothetical protein